MGCDIHLHTELKINGTWHHYSTPRIGRSYLLFEKMAGVRGYPHNAITPPRGFPADVNSITQLEAEVYGEDGHSHSYLTSAEVLILMGWVKTTFEGKWDTIDEFGSPFDRDWNLKDIQSNVPSVEDFRFVFWFDN